MKFLYIYPIHMFYTNKKTIFAYKEKRIHTKKQIRHIKEMKASILETKF